MSTKIHVRVSFSDPFILVNIMEKDILFEKMNPVKALAIMAIPTIASQLLVLFYNIADAWYIGRTNDPYMLAASSLALTVYLASVALSNVFGVGGGSLMVLRLLGASDNTIGYARQYIFFITVLGCM